MGDAAKAVLREKFITINTYLKKQEVSNNRTLHFKEVEKEEQMKLKVSRSKEITEITAETETKKTIQKFNET